MSKIDFRHQAAFTLLELLIVILLISIFYYLVSVSFKRDKKDNNHTISIKNIREYPFKHLPQKGAELICIDNCKRCFIYDYDSKNSRDIQSSIPKIKSYILDDRGEPIRVDFGRLHDKRICLRFRYYPNGSSSEMIISADDKYYYIPPYFGDIEIYQSLSDAVDRYKWSEGKFTDKSDYY